MAFLAAVADVIQHERGTVTAASFLARPAGAATAVGGPASAAAQPPKAGGRRPAGTRVKLTLRR